MGHEYSPAVAGLVTIVMVLYGAIAIGLSRQIADGNLRAAVAYTAMNWMLLAGVVFDVLRVAAGGVGSMTRGCAEAIFVGLLVLDGHYMVSIAGRRREKQGQQIH